MDRRVTAEELLRLQGFCSDILCRSVPGGFTQAQLTDLGGNAFCAGACVSVILASLVAIPHEMCFALSGTRRAAAHALPAEILAITAPVDGPAATGDASEELDSPDSDFQFLE